MSQAYECMGGNPCIPYGIAGISPCAPSFFKPVENAQKQDTSQKGMLASSFTHRATPLPGAHPGLCRSILAIRCCRWGRGVYTVTDPMR